MANAFKGLFGSSSTTIVTTVTEDADFADFAASTASSVAKAASSVVNSATTAIAQSFGDPTGLPGSIRKSVYGDDYPWYAFWERTTPGDFRLEGFVLLFLAAVIAAHMWGSSQNRSLANSWINKHADILKNEFALVGFGNQLTTDGSTEYTNDLLKEESNQEFIGYATGRLNITAVNILISLKRRANPIALFGEYVFSFFFETVIATPDDSVIIDITPADGADASKTGGQSSKYDGFIWAIVNKTHMSKWRTARYDLSLTKTVDTPKLPAWATVMTESAEITESLLTKDLIAAVEQAGTSLQYLLISDQPTTKPNTVEEFGTAKKTLSLYLDLPGQGSTDAIVQQFLRLPDYLVTTAHFRPEVLRKLKSTREDERKELQKIQDDEKTEARLADRDIKKREERDEMLRRMTPDQSRKFLAKEQEKEQRRMAKKQQKKA